ncbi:MAG: RdgB/HAM1 family non-canonical purine NTP pyrophosphatase [Gammaproteobacteria bacterium]|nr:RdgB/HAM1 family non-canonical purine NTP pyrophosphatase [Gammaproteobacteria bacterium]MCZ6854197.1 RdgB/HAM1 family non-canonical purine NTP pyrophosphatase [Gammaproteobacteria bacterium]
MKVVLATNNKGKLKEFRSLLAPVGLDLVGQAELGIASAPETGTTFVENALEKARHVSAMSEYPALSDDSGLVVDCLQGEPGIHSARFAGSDATDEDNNNKLLALLGDGQSRSAHFYCVLVFLRHAQDPAPIIATGQWHGSIAINPKGHNGFGYDPLFFVPELGLTSAELDPEAKNRISHRGLAVQELCAKLAPLI